MTMLRLLACGSVLLFAAGCSSSSGGGNAGGSDSGGSDGTADGMQSGSEAGTEAGTDAAGDAPSDTGAGGDSMSTSDAPVDAGPPGDATNCGTFLLLCNGYCLNGNNDIHNCGACGKVCPGPDPYCDNGHCTTAPCDGGACSSGTLCCDSDCCIAGQLCCDVPSGVPTYPKCTDPVNGTCPVGCVGCP